MITIARSFTPVVVTAALLGMALLVSPPASAAQDDNANRGIWMAGADRAAAGNDWGRLTLQDGALGFTSSTTEWRMDVAAIKRAAIDPVDRLVVENVSGEIYSVTILDARMDAGSPRAALKVIQRALQSSASRRER